jgi:hypothetical protein
MAIVVAPNTIAHLEPADQGSEVHQCRKPLVDFRGLLLRPLEVVDHVENEQGPHSVVVEALPHLGEEEDKQPLGVSQDRAL